MRQISETASDTADHCYKIMGRVEIDRSLNGTQNYMQKNKAMRMDAHGLICFVVENVMDYVGVDCMATL